jgi:hypothetical protein
MSKQFYVYLIPEDVSSLVQKLKSRLDILLISPSSSGPIPIELESAVSQNPALFHKRSVGVDCFLVRKNADIRMRFVPALSHWSVQDDSEVIEFRGCAFDGSVLVRGRFYFQGDFMVQDIIAPKRSEFLAWADSIFKLAKKCLYRSNTLNAYVGEHADRWRQGGGRFAWMVTPERGPIFEDEIRS